MKDGKVFIWMQLLGFNRDDEDRGAKRFLQQTGFVPDGAYRLYLYNDSDIKYHRAFVAAKGEIADARIVSKFPILPPRYMDTATGKQVYFYNQEIPVKKAFEIKIQPAGVTIVDVYLK